MEKLNMSRDIYKQIADIKNDTKIVTPTTERELAEIYRIANIMTNKNDFNLILDLGTYMGFSALMLGMGLLDNEAKGEVITVDNYGIGIEYSHITDVFNKYQLPIRQLNEDVIKYIQNLSNNSIDIAFVDTAHNYNHVYNLLKLLLPKMKKFRSVLMIHDYYWGEIGVVKAINRILKDSTYYFQGYGNFDYLWWGVISNA